LTIPAKTLRAVFFRQASGREPVREWLKGALDHTDRRVIGLDIATVEWGWSIGMPVCRSLGQGLYEVRSSLARGRIARVIFCIRGDRMILLTSFIKISRKTPPVQLKTSLKRMKDIDNA
jgi:phage-related protein